MMDALPDLSPGEHLCCIYQTEAEHQMVLTAFMRRGLEQNQKVIYIVDAHTAKAILDYLRSDESQILPVEKLLENGQLVILSQDEAYTRNGQFDPEQMIDLLREKTAQAIAEGYTALRITGEMTWALRGCAGSERLIEYEAKLNNFLPDSRCLTLCQYDRRCFNAHTLLDVLRTHPRVIIGSELYDNLYYVPPAELLGDNPEEAQFERWLQTLANRKAIQNELNRQITINATIADLSRKLIMSASLDEISALVLDAARTLTESPFGYVGYIDPQSGYLISVTLTRDIWNKCQVADKSIVFKEFKGLWGWVLEHRQSLLSNDPAHDPRASGTPPGHVPIHRFLSAPALIGERLVGQIALANAPHPYTAQDLTGIERIADLYALALERKWEEEKQIAQLGCELATLEQMSVAPQTATTARLFGVRPLRENFSEIFATLVDRYVALLDRSLERRIHKEEIDLSTPLRAMAVQLGYLYAGPRDVIDIHVTALKRQDYAVNPLKSQAYVEEGRLIVLELMGYLVSFYRTYGSGAIRRQPTIEERNRL